LLVGFAARIGIARSRAERGSKSQQSEGETKAQSFRIADLAVPEG